jgi:hypothetical protein
MTQPANVGSQLLYTYQASDHCKKQAIGQSRPATVVRCWGSDLYNVQVLTDGRNDFEDGRLVLHLTSVKLCECIGKGHLCWPGSSVDEAPHVEPAPEETSAPEGASESSSESIPPAEPEVAPAAPEHIQTPTKNKGGRPKKNKPAEA